jgi:hypothetical protein
VGLLQRADKPRLHSLIAIALAFESYPPLNAAEMETMAFSTVALLVKAHAPPLLRARHPLPVNYASTGRTVRVRYSATRGSVASGDFLGGLIVNDGMKFAG